MLSRFGFSRNDFFQESHFCSGTIIDDNAIVTAGHRVDVLVGDSAGRVSASVYTNRQRSSPSLGKGTWRSKAWAAAVPQR